MSKENWRTVVRVCMVMAELTLGCCGGLAQVNSWTNPASAAWENNYWSLGVLPANTQSIMITNAGYKAVGISPSTPVNFPGTMTVSNLLVSAPTNAFSTLLLNYSGTATPLTVLNGCTIGSNGLIENLYAAFEVESGSWTVDGGQFIEQSGLTVATNASTYVFNGGSLNLSNANVQLRQFTLGMQGGFPGTVTQAEGFTECQLTIQGGSYTLLSGVFSGACVVGLDAYPPAQFVQYGGTNQASMSVAVGEGEGSYTLYAGAVLAPSVLVGSELYAEGSFHQFGGSVITESIVVGLESGLGEYSLTNGTLVTGTLEMANGSFVQSGGEVEVTNSLAMMGNTYYGYEQPEWSASYSLSGGLLSSPSFQMGVLCTFSQSGGTNTAGYLSFSSATYSMSGGVLLTSNTFVQPENGYGENSGPSQFLQTGGTHWVSGTLSNAEQYFIGGGTLYASNVVLSGRLSISNPAVILNPGLFQLAGTVQLYDGATESLGHLLLGGNATIELMPGAHRLEFLDSSALVWSNACELVISNWNGSTNGGGADQITFGSSSSGLTSAQVLQIEFADPAGFPPGYYLAQILNSGEIVPTRWPWLLTARSGTNLILRWSNLFVLQTSTNVTGPFTDLLGVTSPYTNLDYQAPRRFFRLRQ